MDERAHKTQKQTYENHILRLLLPPCTLTRRRDLFDKEKWDKYRKKDTNIIMNHMNTFSLDVFTGNSFQFLQLLQMAFFEWVSQVHVLHLAVQVGRGWRVGFRRKVLGRRLLLMPCLRGHGGKCFRREGYRRSCQATVGDVQFRRENEDQE